MIIEDLKAYEVVEKREINDLNSISYILRHKKTGARIAILSNDDNNKVFYIGFRTPPEDSTGVPHIVEHTVLCGSKEFPVKDPFVELVKGSLNTFLNAMTYPDKTVYPVASCNDKDFQNLMHVYLDAVFYPNIHSEEKIFRQEGWHYEMNSPEDELKLNGVVYSEMKGAFSSPDDVFEREIMNSLYPDTTYGVESGGDPDHIPELSYEAFLNFHKRYYHPSNSYIYLYGDMDVAEKLAWMDEHYLSKFDALSIDSTIKKQEAFQSTRNIQKTYPIAEGESLKENTYLSYNMVIGDTLDRDLYVAFQLLDYAICSAQGAPLKQALIDKGIGKDVYSVYENGIAQPYFSIVAKNCEESDKQAFLDTITGVLQDLVKKGIDKRSLEAALNYYEFRYREADFDSYPKGLMYGLQMFDSWLYDDTKPFIHVEANDTYKRLRERISTDYYEQLINKYMLQNTHKSVVVVVPESGLATKKEEELKKKLADYKATLSKEEIDQIVASTKELLKYQEEESPEEDLRKIPMLKREDMKKEAEDLINELRDTKDGKILYHNIFTNGINYIKFIFDITDLPEDLVPYLAFFKLFLGNVDTKEYSYKDLFNEINITSGGISPAITCYTNAKNTDEVKLTFEISAKTFYPKTKDTIALMKEIMLNSSFDDSKRLLEILGEAKSKQQARMMSSGHSLAVSRLMEYFSETGALIGKYSGITQFRVLEDTLSNFEAKKDLLIQKMKELVQFIFRKNNLMMDLTADESGYQIFVNELQELTSKLSDACPTGNKLTAVPKKKNEGFMTSAQVQYVGVGGNFLKKGLPYTGALKVLKVIMGYDYLWINIRVKGGAYGCMSNYGRSGDSYFVSYRDPNLTNTIDVYKKAAEYIRTMKLDERTMTKFIIGAISDMDTPMNPYMKGTRSLGAYMSNLSFSELQTERDELLGVTPEIINGLAAYIEAFVSQDNICVVGNEKAIKEQQSLFMNIENLFH